MACLAAELKKTIVLVGMMGAGKTAVGRALADILAVPFLDSDDEITTAADMTIAEIFDRDGEAFFRARETEVIARLLREKIGVLSIGGGAYLAQSNRKLISKSGVAIWLRADENLLWSRVSRRDTRPLLRTENPRQTLHELCLAREPLYQKAELTVDCHAKYSIGSMAKRVVKAIKSRPDVLEMDNG